MDRVLDSSSRGCGFKPDQSHCIVSLSKTLYPLLVLVKPRNTRPHMPDVLLVWDVKNPIKNVF